MVPSASGGMLPVLSLVPWLCDVGYFMAIDLPELGGAVAQAQTFIITVSCICGALVTAETFDTDPTTLQLQIGGYSLLVVAAIINKITWKSGCRTEKPLSLL